MNSGHMWGINRNNAGYGMLGHLIFKQLLAYALWPHADVTLKTLLDRMKEFHFRLFCTDKWGAYERLLPKDQHLATRKFTQGIER